MGDSAGMESAAAGMEGAAAEIINYVCQSNDIAECVWETTSRRE